MTEEGVIKFDLKYEQSAACSGRILDELTAWRNNLWKLGLIGQDRERYGGYAYGNVSMRYDQGPKALAGYRFLVSGSQTGHLSCLTPEHYAGIVDCNMEKNTVTASGPLKPSSETMTHAMIYAQGSNIQTVLHAHSHDIWSHAETLEIPTTDKHVEYGTPEMAKEVARLFRDTDVLGKRILCMAGHLDGIITFGKTPQEAGMVMLRALARAQS